MTQQPTVESLSQKYADPKWRKSLSEIVNIAALLRHSIIDAEYKVSDAMNGAIVLTDYGSKIRQQLITKHDVPAKEASLICLLEIASDDLIVDVEKTNTGKLIEEISAHIRDGKIKYPLRYTRELYDKAADLFPDRRVRLNSHDTARLLENTPCGVFQVGTHITGPLGIAESMQGRWIAPRSHLALQHCSDVACHAAHVTDLSTNYDAQINRELPKVAKVLQSTSKAAEVWAEFISEVRFPEDASYDAYDFLPAPLLLGECFSMEELREMVRWLHENAGPQVRDEMRRVGYGSGREEKLEEANSGTLLQLCWIARSNEIAKAIDALISSNVVKIAPGEVRKRQLTEDCLGPFELFGEVGAYGFRSKSLDDDLPLLRLQRLVGGLYDMTKSEDREELNWQLRSVEGPNIESRLADFLYKHDPASVVENIVLARKQNVDVAFEKLHITNQGLSATGVSSDKDLVNQILWKLGFDLPLPTKRTELFWRYHGEMTQLVRDALASSSINIEKIKSAGALYFPELEGVLEDSLQYAWWALTNDHVSSRRPFVYAQSYGEEAWRSLSDYQKKDKNLENLSLNGRRTLYPLVNSFGHFSSFLKDLCVHADEYVRAVDAAPGYVGKTDIQKFPFAHTVPFLDLVSGSQDALIEGSATVSILLRAADVVGMRNNLAHFQKTPVELGALEQALDATRRAIERLEAMGFCRMIYAISERSTDRWGRSTVTLTGADGSAISLAQPSSFKWVGMPNLGVPQYLFKGAIFESPGEMLRFSDDPESSFSKMWDNYPRRCRYSTYRAGGEAASAVDAAASSHKILP
ncbi:hypothetical protein KDK95_28400 [Actinospica sp. MGRD01-02]|uniref:Uncharacterized protein n=1 Tax=Actinospica acidithermotolerans TaxID=2828514 RepID=A0A941EGT8_9ACTN|nr:hypothetical protein [Actinospica acidithermotolerans]MBR7830257.1 hypothetical protein [Actinospica acidithermotolerans]